MTLAYFFEGRRFQSRIFVKIKRDYLANGDINIANTGVAYWLSTDIFILDISIYIRHLYLY